MTLLHAPVTPPVRRVKRWTKQEYFKLAEGPLEGKPIYLYRGELIEMASMGALHAFGATTAENWCHDTFRPAHWVRTEKPLEMPDDSVPEPDVAVVTHEQMVRRPAPNAALLVIEVSDSSIELDRDMAFDYAAAGVPDYWVVNMVAREVEVYRDPMPDPTSVTGHRYASRHVCGLGTSLVPLLRPDASVEVAFLTAPPGSPPPPSKDAMG
jgi:Uma2 family endonuclease